MSKARVVLCTNSSIYSTLSLQALLYCPNIEVVGIFISQRARTKSGSFLSDIKKIIQTSGFKYFLYLALGTTLFELFRFPDSLPTTKALAKKTAIPVLYSKDVNSSLSKEWLKSLNPDVLLSSFFNQRLAPATISIPEKAAVNIHPSRLPNYKGVDPVFYYFLNSEPELGVSLHKIDNEFDTGEILLQATMVPIENRSVFWHNIELFREGLRLFLRWIDQQKDKEETGFSGQNTDARDSYDSWPTPAQVELIDVQLFSFKDLKAQSTRSFEKRLPA